MLLHSKLTLCQSHFILHPLSLLLPHTTELIFKPYRESFAIPVYISSYLFLALAVLLSLLGWIATLPVFLGWWHLGRAVSLSPIETAKAFGAPGLDTKDSNVDVQAILKEVGEREVRYGAMMTSKLEEPDDEAKESMRLIIGEPERVRSPKAEERFIYLIPECNDPSHALDISRRSPPL